MSAISPLPPTASPRIAVIGGGISGLAAAYRLTQLLPRAELSLFEASGRLGGVLNTVHADGFLIEQSADNFLVKPSAAFDLCRELGMADELFTTDETRRRAFVVREGKLIPIPEGFYLMSPRKLWPLLASPALSLAGKLRLLAEPLIARGVAASLHDRQPGIAAADESVASFARRRLGREVFERFVQPLVAGIYTADPEQLSMAATMPQFLAYERDYASLLRATLSEKRRAALSSAAEVAREINQTSSDPNHSANAASGARYGLFVAPKKGMSSLVNAVANRLSPSSLHLNAPISKVSRTSGGWQLDIESSTSKASAPRALFDAVVVALPAHAAAKAVASFDGELSAELDGIHYAGCAVASFGFARNQIKHPLDGFGFVVPAVERSRIIAGSFASLKFPGRAPEDHVLIRTFLGGAVQTELLNLSDEELIRIAREELAELLQITGLPLLTNVARWPKSMPQYHVGHLARVGRIEELVARHRNFALAGNAYRGVGIPQCIASGIAAADRLVAGLG